MTNSRPTEQACTDAIIDAAVLYGWLVHHDRPARTDKGYRTAIQGHAGFPDLFLLHERTGRLLVVELKRKPNKVTPEQTRWLNAFTRAGFEARTMWVPEQQEELIAELAVRPQERRRSCRGGTDR